jgi:MurNAc alpha-1-phosphate uridylyltransferase
MTANTPANMPKAAMVMAAGFGTRMRPLTLQVPKPLVRVLGKPLIDYALDFLAQAGVMEVVVNSHYLPELLEAHLAARNILPHIRISREEVVLETGGGIKKALNSIGGNPFFVINSDVICINGNIPALHRLWQAWDDSSMDAILLLHRTENAIGYEGKGDFFISGDDKKLRRRLNDESAPFVFTGVQLLHPRLFDGAPEGAFSLNVLYNKNLGRVGAIVHDGVWLHVGDQQGLNQAENFLLRK